MKNTKIALFGTGLMAYEYAKVLKKLGLDFITVGRGRKSAKDFYGKSGIKPLLGGASKFLSSTDLKIDKAIVAVSGEQLGKVTLALINYGVKSILVEKPGGLDGGEIKRIYEESQKNLANIYIAYNRRFYASVEKAREIIDQDRGVLSFHFEFNELSDQISRLKTTGEIKKKWLLHNSSHVIDLAFFLCGSPKSLEAYKSGSLNWHPNGAIFTGAGISKKTIPFSYHANWLSPGRWGLEIMTKNHRLIFRPLEKLSVQRKNSFEIANIEIDDKKDNEFKPGLFKEVKSFLGSKKNLCTINEQIENISWYNKILISKE